jgi:hypothetical protein
MREENTMERVTQDDIITALDRWIEDSCDCSWCGDLKSARDYIAEHPDADVTAAEQALERLIHFASTHTEVILDTAAEAYKNTILGALRAPQAEAEGVVVTAGELCKNDYGMTGHWVKQDGDTGVFFTASSCGMIGVLESGHWFIPKAQRIEEPVPDEIVFVNDELLASPGNVDYPYLTINRSQLVPFNGHEIEIVARLKK